MPTRQWADAVPAALAAAGIGVGAWLLYRQRSSKSAPRSRFLAADTSDPDIEEGVRVGSHVVAKMRAGWIESPYVYAKVDKLSPLQLSNTRGDKYHADELHWVVLAQDDGWLAPFELDWQEPGSYVIFQLLSREWVSAKVAKDHKEQAIKRGPLHLKLEGVEGLSSVCIQTDVAYLFTPHAHCEAEFGHGTPCRGGRLIDHISDAFKNDTPDEYESLEEALKKQRRRWVEKGRVDGQYPLRSVWVHPEIKQGALNEFARRATEKKHDCPNWINPEIVMLLGPPAAGKSSISRLKADQLTGEMQPLRRTAASLKYREEVNNDNLTDCMPGFAVEYRHALAIKENLNLRENAPDGKQLWKTAKLAVKSHMGCTASRLQWIAQHRQDVLSAEAWALQWLTYLVYHHGPVRDSLALDIIKVTVVDAAELPVYYSSCMAGKAMGRTMMILDLAHSASKPVPHNPLPFRGFWPYTSQEARYDRQAGRADDEKKERKLKGGNLTSNLVDIHYHAQQAELNITRLLGSLNKGQIPSDEVGAVESATDVGVDHFLVIDNEANEPQVLVDFCSADVKVDENVRSRLFTTVQELISRRKLLDKQWDEFDKYLFRICFFFLKVCAPLDDPLRVRAKDIKRQRLPARSIPKDPVDVLPWVTEIDEELFFRKYGKVATATHTNMYRNNEHLGQIARASLAKVSDEEVDLMKKNISVMRKYTCLAILQFLKSEGSWSDSMIEAEHALSPNVVL